MKKDKAYNPLVSVIIPTYNRGWIVKEAIDSVFNQGYRNFELIVVDDGSTDDTYPLINAYKDRIRIIRQDNKGVSAARNAGIVAASGRYIAFLDSDDLWMPEKLLCQVDFFSANPDALICQTEEIWVKNGKRMNPKKKHKKPSGDIFEPSLSLCLVSPSSVMIRQSLIDEVGMFDESLPACEDYDLWLRISCRHPVYLINRALVIKRGGNHDQLSAMPCLDKYRIYSLINLIESGLLSVKQHRAVVRMLKKKCTVYAGGCFKRNRKEEGLYYINLAEQYHP